jgi:hypothetical protein
MMCPLALPLLFAVASATTGSPYLPPAWPANWAIKDSTYVFTDTATGDARFGLAAFGWAFNKTTVHPFSHHEAAKITSEAARVKARNPGARVLMYLNLELGLGWYDDEAQAQQSDPSLFLRYPNGTMISSSPGPTMIQTFWDFREPNVTTYWLQHILAPVVASAAVDGVLFDDCTGFPNEHASVAKAAGIGPVEIARIRAATFMALTTFTHYLASHGKYSAVYEGMDPTDVQLSRFIYVGTPSNSSAPKCVASMQALLKLGGGREGGKPFIMTATGFHSTWHGSRMDPQFAAKLAAFLISRGEHAYYGPSDLYDGMAVPNMSYPELRLDLGGAPLGAGHAMAGQPHRFERHYPHYTVQLDCRGFNATYTPIDGSGGVRAPVRSLPPLTDHAACRSAADCAYSGSCSSAGRCSCGAGWTGTNCTELHLLPARSADAAGLRRRSSSSWGGSVVLDPTSGQYTMFFSDFEGHCGLDSWQRNSRIGVATSATPLGPFSPLDAEPPLGAFAHNPTVHGPAPDGSWLIFHIGDGHATAHGPPRRDCTNGTTPAARQPVSAPPAPVPSPPHPLLPKTIHPDILVSKSLKGPWTKLGPGGGCNNAAPCFLKNGTVLLICKVAVTPMPAGQKPWRQMAVCEYSSSSPLSASCTHAYIGHGLTLSYRLPLSDVAPTYKGPYTLRRLTPIYGEDAYVYYDRVHDAFHMLLHAMHPHKTPTTAWSKDGLEWVPNGFAGPPNPQPRASFNSTIRLAGGGSLQVQRRERHQPIFGREGQLIGLCNGVTTGHADYSFTACVPVGIPEAAK